MGPCMFWQHLSNLQQCYYEDWATADSEVVTGYKTLSAKLSERACPSDTLMYSYYESVASNKVKHRVWSTARVKWMSFCVKIIFI